MDHDHEAEQLLHQHQHSHEQNHACDATCQHIGNLCLSGQCGHPEHMFAAQLLLRNSLDTELLGLEDDEDEEYDERGKKTKKKSSKLKPHNLSSRLSLHT